jgi:hypothetical protein
VNVTSDLVALQIVDRVADDSYKLASPIKSTAAVDLAQHMHAQFARHVVCRELASYDRDAVISVADLEAIVRKMRPGIRLSDGVVHQYAMNLKRWLLFAGHLEERGALVYRAVGRGAQMGVILGRRSKALRLLGSGTPDALLDLLRRVARNRQEVPDQHLHEGGLRNALYDALALQLVVRGENRSISLAGQLGRPDTLQAVVKRTVLLQPSTQIVATALKQTPDITNAALGDVLRTQLKESWKPTSGLRYANGLKRFYVGVMS